jgi:hypothetical protein
MKKLALCTLALIVCTAVQAQSQAGQYLPVLDGRPFQRFNGITSINNEPLLLLGSQETTYSSLLVDPSEIKIVKTYQDSAILASMGYKARNGVVQIELKHKKPLLKLEDVLDYFAVPAQQRQLRVLVNKRPVHPGLFLADVNQIEKIEVYTQDKHHPLRLSWDAAEQFLNIVTKK